MPTATTSIYNPEVTEYMKLNGYKLQDNNEELGLLTFVRANKCVMFWQDRIERRIISADKAAVSRLMKSFKGFDGKNIFHLMLILHLLDAVDLKEVKQACYVNALSDQPISLILDLMKQAL